MADNNGTEKLIERIISDAEQSARQTIEAAEKNASEIKAEGDKSVAAILMECEAKAQRTENDILTKARTNAELDAKKYSLKVKQDKITEVFRSAEKTLSEYPENKLTEFFVKLIIKETDGGETILPSSAHKKAIENAIIKANETLKKMGKAPVTVGEAANISSGFMLSGNGYIKNCSFSEILSDIKEKELSNVAGILFK